MIVRSLIVATLLLAAAGCGAAAPPASAPLTDVVTSNIVRADYAGSAACAGCHPEVTAAWEKSPMRSMTRLAARVPIEPAFDGRTFEYKDDRVTLFAEGGARYMRVVRGGTRTTLHRVSKVIGGRYREDFAGFELDGLTTSAKPTAGVEERVLPVSYLLKDGSLRYKGYSVMVRERPYLGKGMVWRKTCIVCHNTLPHLVTLYDDLLDVASPEGDSAPVYLGSISDRLLPSERQMKLHITSDEGLREALAAEVFALGAALPEGADTATSLSAALAATRKQLGEQHLVEVGIGCEACHGGSREHVQSPSKKPAFGVRSPFLAVTDSRGQPLSRAQQVNRVCARCHTVLFSGYEPTWEGGARPAGGGDSPDGEDDRARARGASRPPGGATINSGEARDFLLGACASQLACTDCHDAHAADGFGDRAAAMGRVCQKCHSRYSTPERIAAHTHHRADGEGSECINCHMPRKNMGLDYRLVRYHRIGSPTDAERVHFDRPLECALCHDDKTAREIVDAMSAWWGKSFDRAALAALYGPDLAERPVLAALARGKPHEQAVAAAVLGEHGRRDLTLRLVPVLSNEIPLVRHFARTALETLVGAPLPWDVGAGSATLSADTVEWISTHRDARTPQ